MQINSRIAGHIVSGHIDTTAIVKDIIKDGFAKRIKFECNTDLIVKKRFNRNKRNQPYRDRSQR